MEVSESPSVSCNEDWRGAMKVLCARRAGASLDMTLFSPSLLAPSPTAENVEDAPGPAVKLRRAARVWTSRGAPGNEPRASNRSDARGDCRQHTGFELGIVHMVQDAHKSQGSGKDNHGVGRGEVGAGAASEPVFFPNK